jgi:PleD family two-component response regulator
VSCGLAELSPGEKKTVEEFLKEADGALYQAKESGKNKVAISGWVRPAGTGLEAEA